MNFHRVTVWTCSNCHNEIPQARGLPSGDLFLLVLEAESSVSRCQDWCLARPLSLRCMWMAILYSYSKGGLFFVFFYLPLASPVAWDPTFINSSSLSYPHKGLVSKYSHPEGQYRALIYEYWVGRETDSVDTTVVQQVLGRFAWERRRVWHYLYSWQTEQALSDHSVKSC